MGKEKWVQLLSWTIVGGLPSPRGFGKNSRFALGMSLKLRKKKGCSAFIGKLKPYIR